MTAGHAAERVPYASSGSRANAANTAAAKALIHQLNSPLPGICTLACATSTYSVSSNIGHTPLTMVPPQSVMARRANTAATTVTAVVVVNRDGRCSVAASSCRHPMRAAAEVSRSRAAALASRLETTIHTAPDSPKKL